MTTWAAANPNARKLGRSTINDKALSAISTLLEQARRDEHIGSNPAEGQALQIKNSDQQARRPYLTKELNRIFSSSVYPSPPEILAAERGWAAQWLPLLGLVTGARLEELGQLLISDVRRSAGIDYIQITTLDEDGGEAEGQKKQLNSAAARRRLPLHAVLEGAGFLDYVAFVRASGATRLFPDLKEYHLGRCTKIWSRWWGRWLAGLD